MFTSHGIRNLSSILQFSQQAMPCQPCRAMPHSALSIFMTRSLRPITWSCLRHCPYFRPISGQHHSVVSRLRVSQVEKKVRASTSSSTAPATTGARDVCHISRACYSVRHLLSRIDTTNFDDTIPCLVDRI